MSLFERLLKPFTRTVYVRTGYRSAETFSPDRSWIPHYVQDAAQDITSQVRLETLRKARFFEANNPYVQKILDLIETNVVGAGIHPTPQSSDAAWNEAALEAWNSWVEFADATSRQSYYDLQAIIARAKAVDGEIFIRKVIRESGRPRMQLIEAHRVASWGKAPKGYIDLDGIWVDETGRPQFYVVHGSSKKPQVIEADRIIHDFEPSRAGQHRGLSLLHAVIPTLHDLDDLQRYEMLAAKDSTTRANVVYTESGEIPDQSPIGASLRKGVASESTDAKQAAYEKAFGAKTVALKRGDKWEQAQALRPSAAMREFWLYLAEQVAKGVGISYAALSDYQGSMGGTALRAALASDNRFYDVRGKGFSVLNREVWRFVIPTLAKLGEIPDLAEGWDKVRWQSPRRATVDVGRESRATLEELRAGVRTLRDVHGEMGLDWKEAIKQRIEEQKFIRDEALAQGLDAGLVLGLLGAAPATTTFAEKAASAIDGDPAQPAQGDSPQ